MELHQMERRYLLACDSPVRHWHPRHSYVGLGRIPSPYSPSETVLHLIGNEGRLHCHEIAMQKFLRAPAEVCCQSFVLLAEGNVRDGACVCADAEGYVVAIEEIDWVVGICIVNVGLHVAAGADFEMNAFARQICHQLGILNTAHPVSNAGRLECA